MNNEKMEPCPGCGLVGERYVRVTRAGCRHRVECICGWQGSAKSSRDEARDAWNLRTDPQRERMRAALEAIRDDAVKEWNTRTDPQRDALRTFAEALLNGMEVHTPKRMVPYLRQAHRDAMFNLLPEVPR